MDPVAKHKAQSAKKPAAVANKKSNPGERAEVRKIKSQRIALSKEK